MQAQQVAQRYARALMSVVEQNLLAEVDNQLGQLAKLMSDASDFTVVMTNPAFVPAEREAVLKAIIAEFKLSASLGNFLLLLLENGRIAQIPEIAQAFSGEIDVRLNRVRAKILSHKPLTEATKEEVVRALHKRLGRPVLADVTVDPSLLGGLKAQIGGLTFDLSLQSQLAQLQSTLSQSAQV